MYYCFMFPPHFELLFNKQSTTTVPSNVWLWHPETPLFCNYYLVNMRKCIIEFIKRQIILKVFI